VAVVGSDPAELKSQFMEPRARALWYADETPQEKISLAAFWIDVTEVTNERYATIVKDHTFPANLKNHPVVNVTWDKADEFCAKAGGRLPTEAEWERAARGGDGRIYPWGAEFNPSYAVFAGSGGAESKLKVGSFELEQSGAALLGGAEPVASREKGKSPFGVYDMAGNVWEWVAGWYDESKQLRLLKGGSWLAPAESLRVSTRLGDIGRGVFNDYGFRCAYDAEP